MWRSKRPRRWGGTKELMRLAYTPKGETARRKTVYRQKIIWKTTNRNSIFVETISKTKIMKVEALKQENVVTGKTVYYIKVSHPNFKPVVMVSAESTYNRIKEMEEYKGDTELELPFDETVTA